MIGVFDSGVGGLASARVLRSRLKAENIIYLADRKNAPYGTKSKEELISLVSNDILRLKNYGCRICLIACCTASSVYEHLDNELKKISLPIIEPAALLASRGRRIAVIATEHTVESSVFKQKIAYFSKAEVAQICAQELVSLVESGEHDGNLTEKGYKTVFNVSQKIKSANPDTLVLGCTHFSHLEKTLSALLPRVKIVNSAKEGAFALLSEIQAEKMERGVCLYTE